MNEELLHELISEIKELNEKMDILIANGKVEGYRNLYSLQDGCYEITGSVSADCF